ncbi:hypothetical protein FB567DRAFT_215967 [Paraphoma chrysanthemicola]|uniref:Uncharacterized protein n=1 Tax=Paraphoma chrysanthemicola TaxID=798071 RepID=A0A8K0VSA0_9PLEO|nr:hypothetical protein FB567DRAFT_215967 [Paraphoma chrysanthemicola]
MSGLEVVAAVSAVVSAFHGGSELVKHIKAKRRKSRQTQQEFEEKQLQDSLVSGEQQIGFRYAQDMRQFGDLMRVGDVIARDQLMHITILMQAEVIKSLQLAAQNEHAVINLAILYEASITNRRSTLVTLDELKHRLLPRLPMTRQLQYEPTNRPQYPSIQTGCSSPFDPSHYVPDNYIPPAVTLPSSADMKESKHGLTNYFRSLKRNSSSASQSPSSQTGQSSTPPDINFSLAFQHLMDARGTQDRAVIMQEIDEIMDSYQGLRISQPTNDLWGTNHYGNGNGGRRDTLTMHSARDSYYQGPPNPVPMAQNLPPTPEHHGSPYPQHPTLGNGVFDQHQEQPGYPQQYPAKSPFPHMQIQPSQSRWSTTSASSSTYSDSPSLNRNSSTSSQDSHTQNQPLPLNHSPRTVFPSPPGATNASDMTPQYNDRMPFSQPTSSIPSTAPENSNPHPKASLSPQAPSGQYNAHPPAPLQPHSPTNPPDASPHDSNSLMFSPYASPYQQFPSQAIAPFAHPDQLPQQNDARIHPDRPKYSLLPSVGRDASTPRSPAKERTVSQSVIAATTLGTAPAVAGLRHASLTPSIASTDSSGSGTLGVLPGLRIGKAIRTDKIQSGPAGSEQMMNDRPCRANNYWGFCRGAWTIRGDVKKGLALRTQPSGLYNTREIWECTSCTFKGSTFAAPHPTKKNKEITIMDPRIYTSQSGVRYKWLFLAKSHVRKRASDSHADECNYGCVLCSLEDRVSSIYGGVETLMNHIALCHVADMSENTRRKARCIIGRMPGKDETEWDINIPVFAQVEELA